LTEEENFDDMLLLPQRFLLPGDLLVYRLADPLSIRFGAFSLSTKLRVFIFWRSKDGRKGVGSVY
jgi:hypothetical protein